MALKARLSIGAAALWWASMTTLGMLVVPMLFVHLPSPALAGAMAAKLFTAQTWISVVCGFILLVSTQNRALALANTNYSATLLIVGGMLLALLAEFAVAPRIVARENLKLWHAVGSAMYLLQWVCAGTLFWKQMSQASEPLQ